MSAAGEEEPDQFAVDVLTFHAALEIEMDHLLDLLLPRAEKLGRRLGFQNKISVINAAWKGTPESGDLLATALLRFNDLRNSVAHADAPQAVATSFSNLVNAVAALNPDNRVPSTPFDAAVDICSFMGDDPGGRSAMAFMETFDRVVNSDLPAALLRRADDTVDGQ